MKKIFVILLLVMGTVFAAEQVRVIDGTGQEVNPGMANRWPISHLNDGQAGVSQLLVAPGNLNSHYVTGYIMTGGAAGDGFYFLRQNALEFTDGDLWTIPDNSTDLDWDTSANDGDFGLEVWLRTEADIETIRHLLRRGDDASDGWRLEVESGAAKFTFHDSTTSRAVSGATAVDDGSWHHIAVVVDRDSVEGMRIYVDGALDATAVNPTVASLAVDGGTTVVASGVSDGTFYLASVGMYIDSQTMDLHVTSGVLRSYNSGIGRKIEGDETGLSFGYNFDEGIGTTHYSRTNDSRHNVTSSGTRWVPIVQSGATAEVNIRGVPAPLQDMTRSIGKFHCGIGTNFGGVFVEFPHPIKIGRNCPLSILETDGAFDLVVFGYTAPMR